MVSPVDRLNSLPPWTREKHTCLVELSLIGFPVNVLDIQYQLSTGFEPGIFTVTCLMEDLGLVDSVSELLNDDLRWGGIELFIINNVKDEPEKILCFENLSFVENSLQINESDVNCTFQLYDCRYMWKFDNPLISDTINPRDDTGKVIGDEFNIKEIIDELLEYATICNGQINTDQLVPYALDADGEPDLDRPVVPFVTFDYENVASLIQRLCDENGYMLFPSFTQSDQGSRVYYTFDVFYIARKGVPSCMWRLTDDGQPDMTGHILSFSKVNTDITLKPKQIYMIPEKTQRQVEGVDLTAVFLDNDGTSDVLRTLDEVSYMPDDGPTLGLGQKLLLDEDVENAERWDRSAFKYYRLPEETTVGGVVYSRREIMNSLLPDLVQTMTVGDGRLIKDKPFVSSENEWMTVESLGSAATPSLYKDTAVSVAFEIDKRLEVIKFKKPVFRMEEGGIKDPGLTFTFCVEVDDDQRSSFVLTAPSGFGKKAIKVPNIACQYDVSGNWINEEDVLAVMNTEIYNYMAETGYNSKGKIPSFGKAGQLVCHGILPITCGDAVLNVSWQTGPSGPETVIDVGGDFNVFRKTFSQKRNDLKLRRAVEKTKPDVTGYVPGSSTVDGY